MAYGKKTDLSEMASGSLGRLLVRFSWPALVAMTLNALYAVVDRVFIGHGCGVDAMAGVQLAMPVVMFLTAFGPLIGVGHSAVLSIKLGEGDSGTCEKLVGETIALKLLLYAVLIPLLYVFLEPVLALCGGDRVTPEAHAEAKTYLEIVLASHLFSHLAFGLSALQRAEGGAIRSMTCMIVGFGANLVLDPILIFGFGLGVAGAAWATVAAMTLSCLWAFGYYWRGKTVVRLRLKRIRVYPRLFLRTLSIGLAPFLQQLLSSLIIASLQLAFTKWMTDEASRTAEIASLGVFNSALILVLMPTLGCQQGLQPLIGYNWGARNYRRVLKTLHLGLAVTTVLTTIAFVIQVVPPFPTIIARLFVSADQTAIITLAAHDLQISNCMIWCISLNIVATTYFQSIGHPWTAVSLSMLRQGGVMLPVIWFLPSVMSDKACAIWLSMPISDVVCCLATVFPLMHHTRFLRKVRERRGLVGANGR